MKDNIFVELSKNDCVSALRNTDLEEFINQVENTELSYRDKIGISKKTTFGVEIEYDGVKKQMTDVYTSTFLKEWCSKSDSSLSMGGEVSSPILHDEINSWKALKKICKHLKKRNVNTQVKAGGHIHVGAHILHDKKAAWNNFLNLWMVYEHVFFRFFYGDKANGRPKIYDFADSISEQLRCLEGDYFEPIPRLRLAHSLTNNKYQSINFRNAKIGTFVNNLVKNTIEFRCPNATVEEVVWQNNINACTKLLEASRQGNFDIDFLKYKANKIISKETYKVYYNEVCLKDALELVDLIFDNNLDKIYFLRQYLKDFESSIDAEKAVYTKRFYKVR